MEQIPAEKESGLFFVRKILLAASYLTIVPCFVLVLILISLYFKYDSDGYIARQNHAPQYKALPENNFINEIKITTSDARIAALEQFFERYNSPLKAYATNIVEEADKNELDYRLLPAIAMQESTLCKKIIKKSFNCWGFGIYGKKVTKFDSYEDAIRIISKTISEKYVKNGLKDPHEIVQKYTPSDNGKWTEVVNLVMDRIEDTL